MPQLMIIFHNLSVPDLPFMLSRMFFDFGSWHGCNAEQAGVGTLSNIEIVGIKDTSTTVVTGVEMFRLLDVARRATMSVVCCGVDREG